MAPRLTSRAFQGGAKIPARYTCDGANTSPPLSWSGALETARSFVIICSDPDAPGGMLYHWAVPHGAAALTENHLTIIGAPSLRGHGTTITFCSLFSTPRPCWSGRGPGCHDVERVAKEHALAETELVGVFAH
jgi:phosphatidylethanolamine-binding protein (PEBP) family uncharacterized protein